MYIVLNEIFDEKYYYSTQNDEVAQHTHVKGIIRKN